jgi:hypothetical protein
VTAYSHRYQDRERALTAGDAACLVHDFDGGYPPVVIVRVNRVTVTICNRYGDRVRLPIAAERNNVKFVYVTPEEEAAWEDPDFAVIRKAEAGLAL